MTPPPTVEEIDQLLATIGGIRTKWHGNPGYARNLDIELHALRILRKMVEITA